MLSLSLARRANNLHQVQSLMQIIRFALSQDAFKNIVENSRFVVTD
jgi:queuine/archaeosine tRNA-ribosyltransferase